MKKKHFLIVFSLVATACSSATLPESAQTLEPVVEPTLKLTETAIPTLKPVTKYFQLFSDQPIVPNGEDGAWDDRFTDPGAVIYQDGMFHMFRNGFRDFPAESQIGYVTSTDGYTWTKQGDEPILKTSDVPFAKIAMYASSAIWQDGCWVLYFYTWDSKSYPSSSVIGRATQCVAGHALTEWIVDAEPVLQPGTDGEWDEKQVLAPHVLKTDNGYLMYYSGVDSSGIQMIGMATSADGVNWTKYNDESTKEKPFLESDPIFTPDKSGAWDAGWVHQPRVFHENDQWIMIYRGTKTTTGEKMAIGMAASEDGIHWNRSESNPLFIPRDIPKAGYLWFHNALLIDDMLYLFIEGDINQTTQIFLATHEGTLP